MTDKDTDVRTVLAGEMANKQRKGVAFADRERLERLAWELASGKRAAG